jgi:predicted nucleic acid-binding protein
MNVYVETNFILELALLQEQRASCERILETCEAGRAELIVPAYAMAEPYETLTRRRLTRRDLAKQLRGELVQLGRSSAYSALTSKVGEAVNLLTQSAQEDFDRLEATRRRIAEAAHLFPLDADVLAAAVTSQSAYDLAPQDAIVYASIRLHLTQSRPAVACFLSRDAKAFVDRDIRNELQALGCRFIPNFDHGYQFLENSL